MAGCDSALAAASAAPAVVAEGKLAEVAEAGLRLDSIEVGGRTVAYGVAGSADGAPVLLFYPAGTSRLTLLGLGPFFEAAGLRAVCVNRPGRGGTSPAPRADAAGHAAQTCDDAVAVLDHLAVGQVTICCMCAGTPFALRFAARHGSRCSGRLLGLACWISPADFAGAKMLYRLGSALPSWLVAPLVGGSMGSGPSALQLLPASMVASGINGQLSDVERQEFKGRFPSSEAFVEALLRQVAETGGEAEDMAVLLSGLGDIGASYREVGQEALIVHGERDTTSPHNGGAWLAGQLPNARLRSLPGGSHEGVLFALCPEVREALAWLRGGTAACSPP